MKRLWFSAVFILAALSLCAFEQFYVYKDCKEIITHIDTAIDETDLAAKKEKCAAIENEWEDFDRLATYITDHAILHSAEISIGTLNDLNDLNEEDTNEALIEAKSEIEQVYDHSRINLSNIL